MVISNHDTLAPLVGQFGIPFHVVSHQGLTREAHEAQMLEQLRGQDLDYLVLAKYMRILSKDFIGQYQDRIINIHHSFLPAFIGGRPYHSWVAFIPPAYETTILFAAFSAVIGMLALNGLPQPYHPVFNVERFSMASSDKFFLVIESTDPRFGEASGFLQGTGAKGVYDVAE